MATLSFEQFIPNNKEAFKNRVIEISTNLGINPNWLMAIMFFESTLDPKARNKDTKATGLIQWMPSTAKEYGTTVDEIRKMSNIQQLDYVEKYFARWKGKINDLTDMYFIVFYPAAIGKSDDYVLKSRGDAAILTKQNPAFDKQGNNNGITTKGEVKKWFIKKIENSGGIKDYVVTTVKRNMIPFGIAGGILLISTIILIIYRKTIIKKLN